MKKNDIGTENNNMRLNLNNSWMLRQEELECDAKDFEKVLSAKDDWFTTNVPCDVWHVLIKNGIVSEPLIGVNSFEGKWIEKKSWWFKREFSLEEKALKSEVNELVLESLDYGADIFLNGEHIGVQMNSYYPFKKNVKELLKPSNNILLIRLTTGLERVDKSKLSKYNVASEEEIENGRGEMRRAFLRKPQYVYGWDWGPRVVTCGIMKDIWIDCYDKVAIRWAKTTVKSIETDAKLDFSVEIENFNQLSTLEGRLNTDIYFESELVDSMKQEVFLGSGLNYIDFEMAVKNPKLWWPNGMGDQNIYQVNVSFECDGVYTQYPKYDLGIKTIEVNQSKLTNGSRKFEFVINGIPVFCKGANWIPADSIYGRVTEEQYEILISEAKEANFNMLRVWGGGFFEKDIFYDLCNKNGIMLWHDFMFACAEYPEDEKWFVEEVEKEIDYQTRKLCNNPSIVLWCGCNENIWAFDVWWKVNNKYGAKIYNYIAPSIVRKNCSNIPYWNCSPYGGSRPNGDEAGDCHNWADLMMNEDMKIRITPEEYDKVTSKFVSEYGYIGPLKRSSVERYLGGEPFDITSKTWQHHNNTFEKDTVLAGIDYHYLSTENLGIDEYLLYAGLCQGLMYGYSLEAFRFREDCFGGLFWMYNDCWGETGWTIIDYYLTRKIPYYFVKRALAHTSLILREKDGIVTVVCANDSNIQRELEIEYGYIAFDGMIKKTDIFKLTLETISRIKVLEFNKKNFGNDKTGVFFAKVTNCDDIPLALLRTTTFRQLNPSSAKIDVKSIKRCGEDIIVEIITDKFAHAVHFNLNDEIRLSDDYFDMLPGENRKITIYRALDIDEKEINPMPINK